MNMFLSRLPVAAAIIAFDEKLSILEYNEHFGNLFSGDCSGLLELAAENCRRKLLQCVHHAAAGNDTPCVIRMTDLRFSFACTPVDENDPTRLLCLFTDVSPLADAMDENRQWTSRLSELASLSGSTLAVCTPDGMVRHFGSLFPSGSGALTAAQFALRLRDSGYLHKGDCDRLAEFIVNVWNSNDARQVTVRLRFDNLNYTETTLSGTFSTVGSQKSFMILFPSGSGGGESMVADPVTGVLSLLSIECMVRRTLETQPDDTHALILIELDRYKQLNESRGRQFGDAVMRDICRSISDSLDKDDVLGRYSGAVLCVFCRGLDNADRAYTLAERLRRSIDDMYGERSAGFTLRCYTGTALTIRNSDSCTELFRRADVDLFKSKSRLHSRYHIV